MNIAKPAALALALLLSSCGFQLRGTANLPFDTLYMSAGGGIALDIKRNIQAGTRTKVVDDPKKAEATLEFTQETREKVILSLAVASIALAWYFSWLSMTWLYASEMMNTVAAVAMAM